MLEENRLTIKNKDRIIEESRVDLRNKDVTVDRLTNTNNVLVQRNNHLIDNYADRPENELLREYIVILRKDRTNFTYDPRDQEEEEEPEDYIATTYKHYKNTTYIFNIYVT